MHNAFKEFLLTIHCRFFVVATIKKIRRTLITRNKECFAWKFSQFSKSNGNGFNFCASIHVRVHIILLFLLTLTHALKHAISGFSENRFSLQRRKAKRSKWKSYKWALRQFKWKCLFFIIFVSICTHVVCGANRRMKMKKNSLLFI
jgi:hypothetical protein